MNELTPRQRRHLRTRDAILDAARQIIAEDGADNLSMRGIADRIDYSAAGLYEYFGGKDEIITAVCQQGHVHFAAALRTVDTTLSPPDYLAAIGRAYMDFAVQNPEAYMLMFTNVVIAARDDAPGPDTQSSYGILLQAIQRGIDSGDFVTRPDFGLHEMALAAWSLVHGFSMLRLTYLRHQSADFAAAADQALQMLNRGLMA